MKTISLLIANLVLFAGISLAGEDGMAAAAPGPFERGTWEVEGGAGYFASLSFTDASRVTINYAVTDLRLGWMYDSPRHNGWLRGNNEFLLETFGGPVTQGPLQGYLTGATAFWRYNFVQQDSRWVPYFQIGLGALWSNEFNSHRQDEIGEGFEFMLQPNLGLKYLVNDQWSISMEGGYRHISNAGLNSRNEGLNSFGGVMQVGYRFH